MSFTLLASCGRVVNTETTTTTTVSTTTTLPGLSANWTVTTIESSSNSGFGEYASLAADHIRGKIHVSYHDSTTYGSEALKYATKGTEEATWETEAIDTGGLKGNYSSIYFDSNGKVHISYYDKSNGDLKYATNALGAWAVGTVEATGLVGLYSSLALDNNDKVHISYLQDIGTSGSTNYYGLKYATNASGVWKTETIESSLEALGQTSIKVDTNNNVHIVYHKDSFKMTYATGVFGSWTKEFFDLVNGMGFSSTQGALYLDSNNKPHATYQLISELRYGKKTAGSWEAKTIDSRGENMSLVLDGNNKAHISYSYYSSPGPYLLKYATNVSGAWATENIASITNEALDSTSIDIGIGGKLHIAFHVRSLDYATGYLKYAAQK